VPAIVLEKLREKMDVAHKFANGEQSAANKHFAGRSKSKKKKA
jgi:hypothetical protein